MAEHGSEYHHGDMDIQEQAATYAGVMAMTKWGSVVLAAALLTLVLWFCTSTGFLGSVIAGVVLLVLGVIFMRKGGGH